MAQMHNIANVLAALRGVSFIGLDMETVVPLGGGKANPMKDRVTKRVTGSTVLVAQNKNTNTYENMVHNRLAGQYLNEALDKADTAKSSLVDILTAQQLDELAAKIEGALAAGEAERRAKAEEAFQVKPRKWGERIPNTPIIRHVKAGELHPNFYLDAYFLRAGKTEYLLDGQPIDEDKIEGLKKVEAKEGDHIQGGLKASEQVQVRSIGLAGVLAIRTGGQTYAGDFYYA